MAALVKKGIWAPAQALSHAEQVPDRPQRAEALTRLLPHLPVPMKERAIGEALTAARGIEGYVELRAQALARLADHLPTELAWEAVDACFYITDDATRFLALRALARQLPDELVEHPDALLAAINSSAEATAKGLTEILALTSDPSQAARLAETIWDADVRARVWAPLSPRLAEDAVREKWTAACNAEDDPEREAAMAALAPLLPDVADAVRAVRMLSESTRVSALQRLAPRLSTEVLREEWMNARESDDDKSLTALVPYVPPKMALKAVNGIDERDRGQTLALLVARLPEAYEDDVIESLTRINAESERAIALKLVAPELPDSLHDRLLDLVEALDDPRDRARALSGLAPKMSRARLRRAIALASTVRDNDERETVLINVLPLFNDIGRALSRASEIANAYLRAECLRRLARLVPTHERPDAYRAAIEAARSTAHYAGFVSLLVRLLADLEPPLRQKVEEFAFTSVSSQPDELERAHALAELLFSLTDKQLVDAVIQRVPDLRDPVAATQIFAALLYFDEVPTTFPDQAVARLEKVGDPWEIASLIRLLAPNLRGDLLERVYQIASSVGGWGPERVAALEAVAPYLPESLLRDAIFRAKTDDDYEQAEEFLAVLVPYLPAPQEALEEIEQFDGPENVSLAVERIASRLQAHHLPAAVALVKNVATDKGRAEGLAALVPVAPYPLRTELVELALDSGRANDSDSVRGRVIRQLAPYLDDSVVGEILPEAVFVARIASDEGLGEDAEELVRLAERPQLSITTLHTAWRKYLGLLGQFPRRPGLQVIQNQGSAEQIARALEREPSIIPELGRLPRPELLHELSVAAAFAVRVGGAGTAEELAAAAEDAGRWWP